MSGILWYQQQNGGFMARNIKNSKELGALPAYRLEYEEQLKDIASAGLVFRHVKSGARVCVVSNNDENKVFIAGFRTPPFDSTGVAHIVEHTVLCGSDKFPLKDPFIELAKGSLNTFLNAMTYPDMTIYPVASCNEKDFQNLMHVYMDAVFHPNIYHYREIFEQEGWHYEMESPDAPLTLNGIVYNEMKGAYSSPEQVLFREILHSLYPDTSYGVDSGGDPEVIPSLTYEAYLDFHHRYYHPSNSWIYLYGDMDVEEKLQWLDQEYLSTYDVLKVDSEIRMQKALGTRETTCYYPIGEEEEEQGKAFLGYSVHVSKPLDVETNLAFQILDTVLIDAPGAPLKQALLNAGIGQDIMSDIAVDLLQPMYSIVSKDTDVEKKDEFLNCIQNTLTELAEKGLNEKSLRAAINKQEFKYREADYGSFPKGLLYGIQMYGSWLYDDTKAFSYMHGTEIFKRLKDRIGTGYFEGLIREYLLKPEHACILTLAPKKGLIAEREEKLAKALEEKKQSLSPKEIEEIVKATKHLRDYQETPATPEQLASIPLLAREDIKKSAPELINKEEIVNGIPVVYHDIYTNGISYLKCIFDVGAVPAELLPYVGLLKSVLGYVDTKQHGFLELSNEVNIHTGGITVSVATVNRRLDTKAFLPVFIVQAKVLYEETKEAMKLLREIISETLFEDKKRLKEILQEIRSKLQMSMSMRGDSVAAGRAESYFSAAAQFEEVTGNISYFRFIDELVKTFDEKAEEVIEKLKQTAASLFSKGNLLFDLVAEPDGIAAFEETCKELTDGLMDGGSQNFLNAVSQGGISNWKSASFGFTPEEKREGFYFPGQVQFVAVCGNYLKKGLQQTGALKVLRTILNYEYLWQNIRVKGGAYGCSCNFSGLDGSASFTSYRDPNLSVTKDVFEKAADYAEKFEADDREMTKYIIGTMSSVDRPLTPAMNGSRSLNALLSGVGYEEIQKEREEILSTVPENIQKTAELIAEVNSQGHFCVVGSEAKIKEEADLFTEILSLF